MDELEEYEAFAKLLKQGRHVADIAQTFGGDRSDPGQVYSPEEMNNLRQAHKLLGYFKEAEKRATSGSQTAERTFRSGCSSVRDTVAATSRAAVS